MDYKALTKEEQDEITVAFLHAQEKDHFCYTINRERYAEILTLATPGPFCDRIKGLLAETDSRLYEVIHIIEATAKQLPDKAGIDAAMARIKAKG